jgi:rSAM/selenodomain-associated transferase 2
VASRISVIIPAWNEADQIERTLAAAGAPEVERIVVDGASDDDTLELSRRAGARVLEAERGRASQMNAGAAVASGEVLLFLHADARLPAGFDGAVRRALEAEGVVAGAFGLAIEAESKSLRLIERMANWRARRLHLPYGDQALFVRAELFRRVGGFPDLPLMEDFELVRRLRRLGRIAIVNLSVTTSARRWQRVGTWRATWINQLALVAYLAGIPPKRIARWYHRERGQAP